MNDVTVVTVAYNSADVLAGMADSLPSGVPMVIVNNGPEDGVIALAAEKGAKLLQPGRNLGFGMACNLGAAVAETDFVFFVNPDVRLEPDTLPLLLAATVAHPEASAYGPVLMSDAGEPTFKRRSVLDRSQVAKRSPGSTPLAVPCLSGAALLVRKSAFDRVGGFDPEIFLYYEDDDLSFRLRDKVGPLLLVPRARVRHFSGKSSPPSATLSRFKGYHWARSRVYVGRKHGMTLPWLNGMKNALWHLIRPRAWRSAELRAEARGRLAGVWSMIGR